MSAGLLEVLRDGNCSACGACVLTGAAERMELSESGDLRPIPRNNALSDSPPLDSYCPALLVVKPKAAVGAKPDPYFGSYLGIWRGHAVDPKLRHLGSSGGALSALAACALGTGLVTSMTMAKGESGSLRTVSGSATEVAEVGEYASSRYAPVSTLAGFALSGKSGEPEAGLVVRPCEASALNRLAVNGQSQPLVLSFFCAGVPSLDATEELVRRLGLEPGSVEEMRYRGAGWPGRFSIRDGNGEQQSLSYAESWGEHLGRRVQSRCKICVDGVGESADVVAGDIWESDSSGFPLFEEAPGQSVIIARTMRGMALIDRAQRDGYLVCEDLPVAELYPAQPLQVSRRRYLSARMVGRRLAGQANPKYSGFSLIRRSVATPRTALRQARGAFQRARSMRSGPGAR